MSQPKVVSLPENSKSGNAPLPERWSNAEYDDSEIDLLALLRTIWRGKWIILLFAVIAVGIGGYYAYRVAVPVYTTTATVALDSQQQNVTDLTSVVSGLSGDQATINTEVEVMRSRGLIEKLVLELDLVSDPEFNASLRPKNPYAIKPLIKSMLGLDQGEENVPPTEKEILDSTIDAVIDAVSISNLRQSYVFSLRATTTSPEKSALLANTLADFYILDQLDVKFKATQQATKWLTDRVAELKLELERATNNVKEFNSESDLVSPEGLAALRRQFKEIRERVANGESILKEQAERVSALQKAQTTADVRVMAEVAVDRNLNRALTMLESGSIDREVFDSTFNAVLNRAVLDHDRAASQLTTLSASIPLLEDQIDQQASDLLKLQQLEQEAAASQTIYEYFLNRLKETSVQQGIQKADSRVLSEATVPTSASAPRKSMILALSMMLGLFSGAGIVLLREMLQTGFRSAEELEKGTGYTVMGQIPVMPVKRRMETIDYLIDKPVSAAAEAVRNLRTSVLLSDVDNPPKVIMVSSSMPGEGKTTGSLAIAHNLAGLGKKCC